jgi:2-phosphosulfolactate phosphatase
MKSIDVLFTPADFQALTPARLRDATCVVFDILRATSSMITALANGAQAIIPVQTIEEALAMRRTHPDVLLAGEREGHRITSKLTGSIDFDFGNSPREFTPSAVEGKTLVMTTTNGTRALRACAGAQRTFVGSFLNLKATLALLRCLELNELILVCSGTNEDASFEDTLAAGAAVESLFGRTIRSDAARIAQFTYQAVQRELEAKRSDLSYAMTYAHNGRRLLGIPELCEDVAFCAQRDTVFVAARLERDGRVVQVN